MTAVRTHVIDDRFRGPTGSGHGGYTAGLVGVVAGNPSEVRLRRPPPLGRELAIERDGDVVRLLDGDDVVAEGRRVGPLGIDVPAPVLPADAAAAARPIEDHPFPECFACGPDRGEGDGLRVFCGPVPGRPGIFASPWLPHESLLDPSDAGDRGDAVPPGIVWAALDCPTAAPAIPTLPEDRFVVLGTLAVDIRGRPRVGYRYALMSWLESRTEKTRVSAAALVAERGDMLAVSRGTWVVVDPARFA